jgi:uncharacterized membrane protein YcaP (DUF421 family)
MDIVIRAVVVFFFLWLVIRVSGKRQIAQLSAFDLILLVTLGDLVAQNIMQEDYSLTAAFIAVSTFSVLGIALSWTSFRFPGSRPLLEGRARIVIREGVPDLDLLRSERLALADLFEAAREQGITDLRDIDLCMLETNGTFSFFEHAGLNADGYHDDQGGAPDDHRVM